AFQILHPSVRDSWPYSPQALQGSPSAPRTVCHCYQVVPGRCCTQLTLESMSHTCCQPVKWGPIHDRSFCTAVPASSSFSHILYAPADRYLLLQNSAHKRNSRTICEALRTSVRKTLVSQRLGRRLLHGSLPRGCDSPLLWQCLG